MFTLLDSTVIRLYRSNERNQIDNRYWYKRISFSICFATWVVSCRQHDRIFVCKHFCVKGSLPPVVFDFRYESVFQVVSGWKIWILCEKKEKKTTLFALKCRLFGKWSFWRTPYKWSLISLIFILFGGVIFMSWELAVFFILDIVYQNEGTLSWNKWLRHYQIILDALKRTYTHHDKISLFSSRWVTQKLLNFPGRDTGKTPRSNGNNSGEYNRARNSSSGPWRRDSSGFRPCPYCVRCVRSP